MSPLDSFRRGVAPIYIEVALHYHCMGGDWRDGDFSAPVCASMFRWFLANDLLEPTGRDSPKYRATERLRVWVAHICETPLPVQRWSRGDEPVMAP